MREGCTPRAWLSQARERLAQAGIPDGALEARWMLEDALGVSGAGLTVRMDEPMPQDARDAADGWLKERLTGRPLQYVQGRAWFMGRVFRVDARALIPRQDTEVLCERAMLRAGKGRARVLDLCTGSGAIGVSLALRCPGAEVWASDLSAEALSLARENAASLGARLTFRQGDLFEAVKGERFDVIACNPPYLTGEDMRSLQREVTYEPGMALYGGEDGLDFYRRIAREARAHLMRGGWLLLEVGQGQARDVMALLGGGTSARDLAGIERVVEWQMH